MEKFKLLLARGLVQFIEVELLRLPADQTKTCGKHEIESAKMPSTSDHETKNSNSDTVLYILLRIILDTVDHY